MSAAVHQATLPLRDVEPSRSDSLAGWTVLAAGSAATAAVLGVFGSIGVLIDPLARELAVPRAQLVPLFGVALLVHSLAGPLVGRVADRLGTRPLLATATVALTVGLVTLVVATDVRLVLIGYGVGLGTASACVWVATSASVSSWFDRQRPLALGILSASGGFGGMLVAPLTAALVSGRGPRTAATVLACAGALLCGLGTLLVRYRPDVGATVATVEGRHGTADGAMPGAKPCATPGALRRFYAASALAALVAFLPVVYLVGHSVDVGLSPAQGAAVLSLLGAVSAAARAGTGVLGRRVDLLALYQACHLLMAVAFAVWAFTAGAAALPMLVAFAVLFGIGYGGWLALGPALLAAVCPAQRLGRALGALAAADGLAGFAGPLLAAPLLTEARPATLLLGSILLVAAAALLPRTATLASPGR